MTLHSGDHGVATMGTDTETLCQCAPGPGSQLCPTPDAIHPKDTDAINCTIIKAVCSKCGLTSTDAGELLFAVETDMGMGL